MIISGKHIWDRCPRCGKMIRLNKFLIGDLHLCTVTQEEEINLEAILHCKRQQLMQPRKIDLATLFQCKDQQEFMNKQEK